MIAFEADEYSGSLPGLTLDVIRTGRGFGSNIVTSYVERDITIACASTRFPMIGRTTTDDDTIIVALITSAPSSTRWCGIDLQPSSMLLYGPGAEHTGISPAGVDFTFTSLSIRALEESAEYREIDFRVPERGRVIALDSAPDTALIAGVLRAAGDQLNEGGLLLRSEDVLRSVGAMLAHEPMTSRCVGRRMTDSWSFVSVCIDYVDSQRGTLSPRGVGARLSIPELCAVAHVSERRLRNAFYDTTGVSPMRFFRLRSLTRARRLLLNARDLGGSIPDVALSVGYDHVSRFSSYYNDVYGEYPSTTMASA